MIHVAKSIIKKDNCILLIKRSSNSKFFPNHWNFPGGKIKDGEDPLLSVIRETKEETSLNIQLDRLIDEFEHNEDGTTINFKIYAIKDFSGKLKLSKDHTDFIWINVKDLEENEITPAVKLHLLKNITI